MSQEVKFFYLKNHPVFANLSDEAIEEACQMAKCRNVFRGEMIEYGNGLYSKLYFLLKGKIKLSEMDDEGNELIKDILRDGDIFGDLGMNGSPSADETAEAMTANTSVCVFTTSDFKSLVQKNPFLALNYAYYVNGKLQKLESRHADLVFRDTKERLIRFINNWAHTDGNRVGDKIVLNNYLTHSDIAGVIATSRQSVNVLLNELRDAGYLFYNRKKIEINSPLILN